MKQGGSFPIGYGILRGRNSIRGSLSAVGLRAAKNLGESACCTPETIEPW